MKQEITVYMQYTYPSSFKTREMIVKQWLSVQSRDWSKWVIFPTLPFKLGHFKNGLGQTMILKLCTTDIIKLTSPLPNYR